MSDQEVFNVASLGALFHTKWKAGKEPEEIIGYWAEDNSRFEIKIPYQLRPLMLSFQNAIAAKYQKRDSAGRELGDINHQLQRVLEPEEEE